MLRWSEPNLKNSRKKAPSTGFEPVTDGLEIRCSIQLSYEGKAMYPFDFRMPPILAGVPAGLPRA